MEIYTSDQIRDITDQNIQSTYSHTLEMIFERCIERAKDNEYQAILYGIEINDTLKKYLETLGYKLIKEENKISYIISW